MYTSYIIQTNRDETPNNKHMICTEIVWSSTKKKMTFVQTLPYLRIIKPIAVPNEIDTRDYITTVGSSSI